MRVPAVTASEASPTVSAPPAVYAYTPTQHEQTINKSLSSKIYCTALFAGGKINCTVNMHTHIYT